MTRSFKLAINALPPVGLAATLFYLSSLPSLDPPGLGFVGEDKLLHIGAYFLLTLSALPFALEASEHMSRRATRWVILFSALYGISDELHQAMVPGRSCDFFDWIADISGAILAVACFRWLEKSGKISTRKAGTPGV